MEESDGERHIRTTLEQLEIPYEQEKEIKFLEGDLKEFRRADFFLPTMNMYIEFLGGWNASDDVKRDEERRRYKQKKEVYERNNLHCIYIYPHQLHYLTKVIQEGIAKFEDTSINREKLPIYRNPLVISFSFFAISSFLLFSSIAGSLTPWFFLVFFLSIVSFFFTLKTRCSNCGMVFVKEHLRKEYIRTEARSWHYVIETKFLYSDGSYKNSTFSEQRTRIEKVNIFKNVFRCNDCNYRWTTLEEVNLDFSTRPDTVRYYRTHYRNPQTYVKKNFKRSLPFRNLDK